MRGDGQLRDGHQFLAQAVMTDFPVLDQHGGLALDQPIEILVLPEEAHDGIVDRQERRGAEDATRHRIVVADDRVLHRVRERQQDDEIERVQLRELALAGETQPDDQERVHQHRP